MGIDRLTAKDIEPQSLLPISKLEATKDGAGLIAAIEQAAEAVVITDTQARIQYVNPAFCSMTGYSSADVIGQSPRILKSGKQGLDFYRNLWKTITSGGVWHSELINRRKDGTYYTEEMTITPVRDVSGATTNFIAIKQDVTNRRAAEDAQRFLASIVENSDDAIIAGTLDGIVMSWNRGAEQLYGYTPNEMVGQKTKRLVPADHREEFQWILDRIRGGERIRHLETVRVKKDGTRVDVSLSVSPLWDKAGRVAGAATIARDISERKQAELAIRRSEERYRSLIDSIPDVVWAADTEGRVIFVSRNIERIYGYTPEEICNGSVWFDRIHPDDAASVRTEFQDLLANGKPLDVEYRLQRKDGDWIWHHAKAYTGTDQDGHLCINGTGSDVTERKRAQEQLVRAKEAAEAASRAKSEFLANMSHEIRTPMNGVIGMTDLVLDTQLTHEQRDCLNVVKSSADSLLTVINDILDFSKIEARKLNLECINFDLRAVMNTTMKAFGVRAAQKDIELTWHVAGDVPATLMGDPERVRQVLVNLIGNALKFTEQGGVNVSAGVLSRTDDEIELEFSVNDTGVGIPLDKQDAIYQAFVQADTSLTRRFGGTGLGLAIASQLVGMMHGRIALDSELGKGTTFTFTARLKSSPEPAERPAVTSLRDQPVLVVDDNAANRRTLGKILNSWGMRLILSSSGAAALEICRKIGHVAPLVIVDSHMPEMDGYTLVQQLKKEGLAARGYIMMIPSAGHQAEAARCRDAGVCAHISKPIGEDELRDTVLDVLGFRTAAAKARDMLPAQAHTGASLRILVVEDNPVNQRLAVRLVEKHGHSAGTAANGQEALNMLDQKEYDLILMDVQMPVMNGLDASLAIREREKATGAHVPIVALTAHAMQSDKDECLASGVDDYLSKPIRGDELLSVIERTAGRRRLPINR